MKKQNSIKIAAYIGLSIVGCLLLTIILGWLFIKPWTAKKLNLAINENPNLSYSISYTDYDMNLISRTASFKNLIFKPKSDTLNNGFSIIETQIEELDISGIGLVDLFRNKFTANAIHIKNPHITLKKGAAKTSDTLAKKPFEHLIAIDHLQLSGGTIQLRDSTGINSLVYLQNLDFDLHNLAVDSTSLKDKIPFRFENYQIHYDSLYAKINAFYTISTLKTSLDKDNLDAKNIHLKPLYSRADFQKKINKETDLFEVKNSQLHLSKISWSMNKEHLEFSASNLLLDSLDAVVYRNKAVADDTSIKPLFSKKLRDLNFFLALDTVNIKHSAIEYIEQIDFNTEASHITFDAFNAEITDLLSGIAAKEKKKKTKIKVHSKFMNNASLQVNWDFDVNNASDQFTFSGSIHQLPTANLNTFLRPQINATTTGTLEQVFFNIYGNNKESKGDFKIKYHDFKIEFLRKNGQKKNKFLSAIGNLFVRKDTDNTFNEAEIEQLRNPEKSFFNFMWISLADGLKKTFLVTNSKQQSKDKD